MDELLREIRMANRQIASGHYIEHDDMVAWLLSWGTEHELPPPKCICGRDHDDEPGLSRPTAND